MPRPAQLSIDLLETFIVLVRHDLDTAQAMHVLGINQPSLSKRLKSLQHAGRFLQRPWLKRVGKTWTLSAEGRRVLPAVRELLDRYQILTEFTNAPLPASPPGALRFACGQTSGAFVVRRAMADFLEQHPGEQLQVFTMRAPQSIVGVAAGSIDMALTGRDDAEIRHHARGIPVDIEEIGRFGYCLACAEESEWAERFKKLPKKRALPLSVLAEFPLIVPEADSHIRHIFDPIIHRQSWGKKVEYRAEIGGWMTILDYVRTGLGVGLISELAVVHGANGNLHVRSLIRSRVGPLTMKLVTRHEEEPGDKTRENRLRVWRGCLLKAISK
jgi:DNA-binding transcriptional LysR family regulator